MTFVGKCTNRENLICTPAEATEYAKILVNGIRIFEGIAEGMVVFKNSEKIIGSTDQYTVNLYFRSTVFNFDPLINIYFGGNRTCPVGLQSSGLENVFADSTGVHKFNCIVCGINKYYRESEILAPFIVMTKTMYIQSAVISRSSTSRFYYISSSERVSSFGEYITVDIGTNLILKIGESTIDHWVVEPSSRITRVEYENQDILFTSNDDGSVYSIEFKITQKMS